MAGASLESKLASGSTASILASQNGHKECATALLEKGADVNSTKKNGFTALTLVAQNGHEHVALELLKAGATLESKTAKGFTALMLSCKNGHLEVSSCNLSPAPVLPIGPNALLTPTFALSRSLTHCSWQTPIQIRQTTTP